MNYKGQLKSGQEILLQNDGQQTYIQLQNADSSGHESQGTSFETGEWSKAPQLFATSEGAVLQVNSQSDTTFFEVTSHGINRMEQAPDLDNAHTIELHKTDEEPDKVSIEPMKPMEPMKPLF